MPSQALHSILKYHSITLWGNILKASAKVSRCRVYTHYLGWLAIWGTWRWLYNLRNLDIPQNKGCLYSWGIVFTILGNTQNDLTKTSHFSRGILLSSRYMRQDISTHEFPFPNHSPAFHPLFNPAALALSPKVRSNMFCGCTSMAAGVNCVKDQCRATWGLWDKNTGVSLGCWPIMVEYIIIDLFSLQREKHYTIPRNQRFTSGSSHVGAPCMGICHPWG